MAAPLETLDQIRDSFIARGIGNSGLTTQAIQRANLPELRTELATANAIRQEQENQRNTKNKIKQLQNLSASLRANEQGGSDTGGAHIGLNQFGFTLKGGLGGVFRGASTGGVNTGDQNVGTFAGDIISALKNQNESSITIDQPSALLSNLSGIRDQLVSLLRQQGVKVS